MHSVLQFSDNKISVAILYMVMCNYNSMYGDFYIYTVSVIESCMYTISSHTVNVYVTVRAIASL